MTSPRPQVGRNTGRTLKPMNQKRAKRGNKHAGHKGSTALNQTGKKTSAKAGAMPVIPKKQSALPLLVASVINFVKRTFARDKPEASLMPSSDQAQANARPTRTNPSGESRQKDGLTTAEMTDHLTPTISSFSELPASLVPASEQAFPQDGPTNDASDPFPAVSPEPTGPSPSKEIEPPFEESRDFSGPSSSEATDAALALNQATSEEETLTTQPSPSLNQDDQDRNPDTAAEPGEGKPLPVPPLPNMDVPQVSVLAVLRHEGSRSHCYEDAFYPDAPGIAACAAVADGATQGLRSGLLAETLIGYFAANCSRIATDREAQDDWWRKARRDWFRTVLASFNNMGAEEQDRFPRGGATTFLGVVPCEDGNCQLVWVGDCFAFWLKDNRLIARYPEQIEVGGVTPDVLNTQEPTSANGLPPGLLTVTQPAPPAGDILVLSTDALGAYLDAHAYEEGFWQTWLERFAVGALDNQDDFISWAKQLREAGELVPDDYTAVIVRFPSSQDYRGPGSSIGEGALAAKATAEPGGGTVLSDFSSAVEETA